MFWLLYRAIQMLFFLHTTDFQKLCFKRFGWSKKGALDAFDLYNVLFLHLNFIFIVKFAKSVFKIISLKQIIFNYKKILLEIDYLTGDSIVLLYHDFHVLKTHNFRYIWSLLLKYFLALIQKLSFNLSIYQNEKQSICFFVTFLTATS